MGTHLPVDRNANGCLSFGEKVGSASQTIYALIF